VTLRTNDLCFPFLGTWRKSQVWNLVGLIDRPCSALPWCAVGWLKVARKPKQMIVLLFFFSSHLLAGWLVYNLQPKSITFIFSSGLTDCTAAPWWQGDRILSPGTNRALFPKDAMKVEEPSLKFHQSSPWPWPYFTNLRLIARLEPINRFQNLYHGMSADALLGNLASSLVPETKKFMCRKLGTLLKVFTEKEDCDYFPDVSVESFQVYFN